MIKREANFGVLFRHWVRSVLWLQSGAFELKQTTTGSFPFDEVQEHQLDALLAAQTNGILYKIPDDSRGIKPFDMVYLKATPSYVVIRYPDFFCLILVNVFIQEKKMSTRKSLLAFRARAIALVVVDL